MKILTTTPVVHVSNLQNAVAYYTNILAFKLDFEFGDYVGLTYGNMVIHLSGPTNQGAKKAAGSAHFCFYCDNVNAYYEKITAKGALLEFPIDNRIYGLRDFAVNDEDGNTLVFGMDC
jgi:catechol 2,3-dioxygenase-like lactoylglutathione lyase family enzyme